MNLDHAVVPPACAMAPRNAGDAGSQRDVRDHDEDAATSAAVRGSRIDRLADSRIRIEEAFKGMKQ
jgi:hypothetical protein